MTNYCNKMTYPETLETPAEFCDEPTVEGADYCEYHLEEE